MKVLVIDTLLDSKNPTYKSWMQALRMNLFSDIQWTFWCMDHAEDLPEFGRIELMNNIFSGLGPFDSCGCQLGALRRASSVGGIDQLRKEFDVILTSGGHCYLADVSLFQFFNPYWMKVQLSLPGSAFEFSRDTVKAAYGGVEDHLQMTSRYMNTTITVSERMVEIMRPSMKPWQKMELLPNAFDPPSNKSSVNKTNARQKFNMEDSDFVFLFASQGHFRRKGLPLAVDTVAELRRRGKSQVKLLVVGGAGKSLARAKKQALQSHPESEKWIHFSGMVDRMDEVYAASDAFLFPSYFEAFSLVEIEAASKGLPLLLTPHPGAEMIIEDGINGFCVEFDAQDIADKAERLISGELVKGEFEPGVGRSLSLDSYASSLSKILEHAAERRGIDS